MNDRGPNVLTKTLAFGVVMEVATGLALIFKPALVIKLLLGVEASGMEVVMGRCFGIGLFGLVFACWPDRQKSVSSTAAFRGMLIYNALIAAYLAYLGLVGHLGRRAAVAGRRPARRGDGAAGPFDAARAAGSARSSRSDREGVQDGNDQRRVARRAGAACAALPGSRVAQGCGARRFRQRRRTRRRGAN